MRTQRSSDKLRGMLRDEPLQRLRIVVGDYTTASGGACCSCLRVMRGWA